MTTDSYSFPFADCSFLSSFSSPDPAASVHNVSHVVSTRDKLTNTLNEFPGKFSLSHLNVRSMKSHEKFYDFQNIFLGSGCDIICVTESWLDSSIPDSEISFLGYRTVRLDRVGRKGGGIAIYLNNSFSHKVLASSSDTSSSIVQFIILEVVVDSSKILLAVIYNPPPVGSLDEFEHELEFHLPSYQHRFIVGDFNVDPFTTSSVSAQLSDLLSSLNLHVLPTGATRHTATSDSRLDLMVVGDESSILTHGKLTVGSSDHDLMYLVFNLFSPRPRPKLITCRNFKNFNPELFSHDATAADWNSVYSLPDIDSKVLTFNNIVISLFDKHAPFYTFRAKQMSTVYTLDVL
uniref:Endonuclease/exonuclease/phosphatase domain-containing protein n=1 Tax=Cacopsylla melanoneura TaxID=428564 RepID=A0A8D9DUG8_9HEMI